MIRNTEIAYNYGGDPSIPNLNYQDMYFYATGGVPNNPGFNSLPEEVQRKIIANMKRFGGAHMGYYQGDEGGSSYYEEIDPMTGMYVDPATMNFYQGYDEGIEESMPYSETTGFTMPAPSAPNYGPVGPAPSYGPVGPFQTGAGQRGLNSYKGVSVVDFLNKQGVASDYATRKQIAQTLGISNYRGTANQNLALIDLINKNPNILNGVGTSKGRSKKYAYVDPQTGKGYTQEELDAIDAGLIADAQKAIANQRGTTAPEAGQKGKEEVPFSAKIGPQEKAAVAAIGVAGTAYLVNKLGRAWVAQNGQRLKDLAQAGLSADDIVKMAKSQGRAADTYKLLTSRGISPQEANKLLKGIKFQSAPVSKQVIAGVEQAGANIQKFVEASEKAQKQAQALVQFMRTKGMRDPRAMEKLKELVPNPAKRMAMLKNIKMAPAQASTTSKIMSYLPKAAKYLKYLRFDDGGSYMPMYQGDEGGSEYDIDYDNGKNWYSEQNEWLPGYWNDAFEIFEPTGVSGWDDLARSIKDPNSSGFDVAMNTLGVIPVFGKIGKAGKLLKVASESSKVGKAAKEVKTGAKVGSKIKQGAKIITHPVNTIYSYAPGYRNYSRAVNQMLEGAPKVVRGTANTASYLGKGERFFKPINRANKNNSAQEIIDANQPLDNSVLLYTPDGTVMAIDPTSSEFARFVESNAIDTTASGVNAGTGAFKLDPNKVSGPVDWKAMKKKYATGQSIYEEGGDYGYMQMAEGGSFNKAFGAARKRGDKTFTWNGKLYGTKLKSEADSENNSKKIRGYDGKFYTQKQLDQIDAGLRRDARRAIANQSSKSGKWFPPQTYANPKSFVGIDLFSDTRNLESGTIIDKGTNTLHIIKNGKIIKSSPVLTGQAGKNKNRDPNSNLYTVDELASRPEARSTVTGTYMMNPEANIYGYPGFGLEGIPAFGQKAPPSDNTAIHITYGAKPRVYSSSGPDKDYKGKPEEFARRNAAYSMPSDQRYMSYGCTNAQGELIDCLQENFPQPDSAIVIDSRDVRDLDFMTRMQGRREEGGSTWSGNAFYPDGGTFVPMYDGAYGALPEYGMGSDYDMYAYGGIHIKPENKGKFTKKANAAGMSVQQFASKVLSAPKGKYSASTRKQANFAKNAAGWKKQDGGMTGQEMYVTPEQMEMLRQQGYDFDII